MANFPENFPNCQYYIRDYFLYIIWGFRVRRIRICKLNFRIQTIDPEIRQNICQFSRKFAKFPRLCKRLLSIYHMGFSSMQNSNLLTKFLNSNFGPEIGQKIGQFSRKFAESPRLYNRLFSIHHMGLSSMQNLNLLTKF